MINDSVMKALSDSILASSDNVTVNSCQLYKTPNNINFIKAVFTDDSTYDTIYATYYDNKEILLMYDSISENEEPLLPEIIDSIVFS